MYLDQYEKLKCPIFNWKGSKTKSLKISKNLLVRPLTIVDLFLCFQQDTWLDTNEPLFIGMKFHYFHTCHVFHKTNTHLESLNCNGNKEIGNHNVD